MKKNFTVECRLVHKWGVSSVAETLEEARAHLDILKASVPPSRLDSYEFRIIENTTLTDDTYETEI